ncbi:ferric reductase NAD binding domain-containing protein [Dipodascopsis uninucleata]
MLVISFLRLLSVRIYPKKGRKPNGFITAIRKKLILPAVFGKTHIQPIKWGNLDVFVLPLRWQTIVMAVFWILDVILLFVDMQINAPNEVYYTTAIERSRFIADRAGIMALCLWPVVFLFGTRNNILQYITGWSFETFNVFHRLAGRTMVMNGCVHGIAFTFYYRKQGTHLGNGAYETFYKGVLQDLEDRLGVVAISIGGAIVITSFYVIRHNFYETFRLFHLSLVIIITYSIYHHVKDQQYTQYVYTAIAVWAFDWLIRICKIAASGLHIKASMVVHGDATYLTVKPSIHFKPSPGQYAFIYVLRHNFWESHPFSIMKSRNGEYVFVAKAHEGMTGKIHKSVSRNEDRNEVVRVWIEGPYGDSFPIARYETVLLVAGGIGITAMMSYALDLKRRGSDQHVILYWVVRNKISLNWVKDQLDELSSSNLIDINIFVTNEDIDEKISDTEDTGSGSASDDEKDNTRVQKSLEIKYNQRPDMNGVIADTVTNANGSVAVVSCGPGTLADACRNATTENVDRGVGRVDYFEDAFSWA